MTQIWYEHSFDNIYIYIYFLYSLVTITPAHGYLIQLYSNQDSNESQITIDNEIN